MHELKDELREIKTTIKALHDEQAERELMLADLREQIRHDEQNLQELNKNISELHSAIHELKRTIEDLRQKFTP